MKKIDYILLTVVAFLTFFGLLMIYDASSYIAFRDFGDKYHYIKEQSMWVILGFTGLFFFSFYNYRKLYYLSLPALLVAIVLLILVFIPGLGVTALGARRWIDFGFFILQPAEFVKLALAIYLSAWFSNKEKGRFLAFALLLGLVLFLVMLEPDMGTAAIILSQGLIIYFLSGGNIFYFLSTLPIIGFLGFLLIKLEPYRAARLATFFDPNSSLLTSSYHVKQILIAFGMGGLTGVGLGNSLQKYAYLPENTTDSIFAIIAEEFGFIGSVFLIILFIIVVWRGFLIAGHAKDTFGKLLAGGIISFLAVQFIINLGAQTALIPLTGVPLPFISYGGSALVIDLCSIGILLNISKQKA
ncbi:MAG: cell division protein FtsW [Candidatus Levybacteria bacterium RIFCSPHIGHO2_02_FULL_37_10]|nr:MAG: cell division protein FtsW [Candidatus Levybacteria bacterium RIFCSPHIGHO2_02_FULL_37_10]